MIINPKNESLKQDKIDLTGYFISSLNLEVLRLVLVGLRTDNKYDFELYPVKAVYNGVTEDSFFIKPSTVQRGLGVKLLEIADALGEESILSNIKTAYVVPTDTESQPSQLELDRNEVLHHTDKIDVKGDYSLIDIGGGWYQLVVFKAIK